MRQDAYARARAIVPTVSRVELDGVSGLSERLLKFSLLSEC